MSPRRSLGPPSARVTATASRLALKLGLEVHEERRRRGWAQCRLARRAGLAPSTVRHIELGGVASLETYCRMADALGLEPTFGLQAARRVALVRDVDPVHAAMCEALAAQLRPVGFEVLLDEPYQHYQHAGRADLVAIDRPRRALLHVETRTRFPDIQDLAGSFNGKRVYLPQELARRLPIDGGFASVTHAVAALWSSEVLHVLRIREHTFRSLCPQDHLDLTDWWTGQPLATPRISSTLILFDPLPSARASRRRFVGMDTLAGVRPRYRGYADALAALRQAGQA